MNRYLRNWACFLFMVMMMWQYAVAADYTPATAFQYSIANNQVTITKFIGSQTEVSIPPTIEGKPVVAIGYQAFYNKTRVTSVTIPEGVTSIGGYAFYSCRNLTSVTIPSTLRIMDDRVFYYCTNLTSVMISNGATVIGEDAFWDCWKLAEIVIPASVTTIGDSAFINTSLTSIIVDAENEYYTTVDGVLFNKSKTMLVRYPPRKLGIQYSVPSGVTTIVDGAFNYCAYLTSLTIPQGVTTIGSNAFSGSLMLAEINISASVTKIEVFAFDSCNALLSINVDAANASFASVDGILFNKSKTTLLRYPQGKPDIEYSIPSTVTAIGTSAFDKCTNLRSITIPSSVKSISSYVFYGCTNLISVTIPDSVTSIGWISFFDCTNLTSVTLPSNLTTIKSTTFAYCKNLASITIPSTVTSIEDRAFDGCDSLTKIEFSGAPPVFGNNSYPMPITFYVPANMGWEEWEVPSGVTLVLNTESVFIYTITDGEVTITGYKGSATDLVIPSTIEGKPVVAIGEMAFNNLSDLISVTIPSSVTSIGHRAFSFCLNLSTVEIPESVTSIGSYAFYCCYKLASVTIPSGVTTIEDSTFQNCSAFTSITIPSNVTSIGNLAFCCATDGLTSVVIPSSVTSIGYGAFVGVRLVSIDVDSANAFYASVDGVLFNKSKTMLVQYPGGKSGTQYSIPSSVTAIERYAFYGTRKLAEVVIPASVASIGDEAFGNSFAMEAIHVDSANASYASVDGVLFDKSKTVLLRYPQAKADTDYSILDGVTDIESNAFNHCRNLTSVTIPSGVISVGENAFVNCGNLTSATIASSVTTIENRAFYQCYDLSEIVFEGAPPVFGSECYMTPITFCVPANMGWEEWEVPDGVTLVVNTDSEADYTYTISDGKVTITGYKGSNTDIRIPSRIEGKPVVAIGYRAFYNNRILISVTIPSSIKSIGGYAFDNCYNLTSVTISEGVESIGYDAFCYCRNLTSVTIPSTVRTIGSYAFYECSRLTTVTILDGVASIGNGAFHSCSKLAEITIPASVTSIGDNAFYWCQSLATITVDEKNDYYVSVDGILFDKSMTKLVCYPANKPGTEYSIPSSVTTIAYGAFCCCRLSSVTIPQGVTTIGRYAFAFSYFLPTVDIPASVTDIADGAFHACTSLSSIPVDAANPCYASSDGILFDKSQTTLVRYPPGRQDTEYSIPSTVTVIGYGAFGYCENLTSVTIPSTVRTIGEDAFFCCSELTSVIIQEGVTSIGDTAFVYCYDLTSVTIPSTVTSIGYRAFDSCDSLIEMVFMGTPPTFDSYSYPTPIMFYVPANMGWEEWEVPSGVTLEFLLDVQTQTIQLNAGWNWVGFTMLPENRKVGNVLGTTGFSVNDIIQTNSGTARFTGASWMPGSFTVDYGKLYQIYVADEVELSVGGEADGPSSVPLASGWNWIANSTLESVTPAELNHSGGWTVGDRIQSPAGSVIYTGTKWVPATGFTLESGKGYQIYAANEGTLSFGESEENALYAVVDLSEGPDAASYSVRYSSMGPDMDDDTCRTTELWLRKVDPGTFTMGAPSNEVGYNSGRDMAPHEVTLTQGYYIGVFECTQKQWELVMGSNPSEYTGDCRPAECISYDMIRGTSSTTGAGWPACGHAVDAASFMGKLQEKTGLTFDLPTEAQWEYACRAGTTTALNSGKNLTSTGQDSGLNELGRYNYDKTDGKGGYSQHTKVGSYLPNAFGLYDMHGNVWEWCLNWGQEAISSTVAETDPVGATAGSTRVRRGGGWSTYARSCRAGSRDGAEPQNYANWLGFRVALLP